MNTSYHTSAHALRTAVLCAHAHACSALYICTWLWSRTRGTYAWHARYGTVAFRTHACQRGSATCRHPAWDPHGYMPSFPDLGLDRAGPRLQQKIPSQLANHHPGPGMHPPYGMASLIYGARSSHYVPLQPYRTLRLHSICSRRQRSISPLLLAGRPASSHARLRSLEE